MKSPHVQTARCQPLTYPRMTVSQHLKVQDISTNCHVPGAGEMLLRKYLILLSSTHLQCCSGKKVPSLTDFITVTALTSAGSISGRWGLPLPALGVSRASWQHRSRPGATKLTCALCFRTSPALQYFTAGLNRDPQTHFKG